MMLRAFSMATGEGCEQGNMDEAMGGGPTIGAIDMDVPILRTLDVVELHLGGIWTLGVGPALWVVRHK